MIEYAECVTKKVRFPILAYHQVSPKEHPSFDPYLSVTPETLKKQICFYLRRGWRIETLDRAEILHERGESRIMAITFDDVASTFREYAEPVLLSLGVGATLFVIVNSVIGTHFENLCTIGLAGLTLKDLRLLRQAGFEIGSHTCSHRNLTGLTEADALSELVESKGFLESALGEEVGSICYPLGGYDELVVQRAYLAGYKRGVTTERGNIQTLGDEMKHLEMKRVRMSSDCVSWLGLWYRSSFFYDWKYKRG